jgi:ribonuclease VapC
MPEYVYDSSVILAIILNEPGMEHAVAHIHRAIVSSVNLTEIVTKLFDLGVSAPEIDIVLAELALDVVHFDTEQALAAGSLRSQTRRQGLSLGDRACLALAKATDRIAMTADRAWVGLDHGVQIELIR